MRHLAACSLLLASFAGSPASAGANDGPPATTSYVDHCNDVIVNRPEATLGECVSFNITREVSDQGNVSHWCDLLEESFPDDFYLEFNSHADCVRAGRAD
jgi:hypothetical protein